VFILDNADKVVEMIENNNGFITTSMVTEAGVQRRTLTELVEKGSIYRVERGIYSLPDTWEDEMYHLQYRFSKGIFSNETALYLHDLSDRTPIVYTMTFPHGYNAQSAKKSGVIAKFTIADNYGLGVTEVSSPCGNVIKVYDKERTLCDIVKGNNSCDISLINKAMKTYAHSYNKNINKLISYAEQLRVRSKILRYMEVLL